MLNSSPVQNLPFLVAILKWRSVKNSRASKRDHIDWVGVPCYGLIWIWMEPRSHFTKWRAFLLNRPFQLRRRGRRMEMLSSVDDFEERCRRCSWWVQQIFISSFKPIYLYFASMNLFIYFQFIVEDPFAIEEDWQRIKLC